MTENRLRPKLVLPDAAAALRWYAEQVGAREVSRTAPGAAGSGTPFGVQWLLQTEVTMSPDEVREAFSRRRGGA